jgi:hypothetical protein
MIIIEIWRCFHLGCEKHISSRPSCRRRIRAESRGKLDPLALQNRSFVWPILHWRRPSGKMKLAEYTKQNKTRVNYRCKSFLTRSTSEWFEWEKVVCTQDGVQDENPKNRRKREPPEFSLVANSPSRIRGEEVLWPEGKCVWNSTHSVTGHRHARSLISQVQLPVLFLWPFSNSRGPWMLRALQLANATWTCDSTGGLCLPTAHVSLTRLHAQDWTNQGLQIMHLLYTWIYIYIYICISIIDIDTPVLVVLYIYVCISIIDIDTPVLVVSSRRMMLYNESTEPRTPQPIRDLPPDKHSSLACCTY